MAGRPRWSLSAVALVTLLVVAGCSGLPTTDQQPSAPETTVENFSYPTGWSQDGITDIGLPEQTHDDVVQNVSRRARLVVSYDDGNRTVVRTVDVEAGTASLRWNDTLFGNELYTYFGPEGVFEYNLKTNELVRPADQNWTMTGFADIDRMGRPLTDLALEAADVVTVEGTPAVRYNVTGIDDDPYVVPATDASGYITVTQTGYIASYDITRRNDDFTNHMEYRLSEFGNATVDRPSWLPDE
ncbi:hypothetical protein [Halobacterium sp. KA-6]|uniref:hypothetical protein n=1 Tax=Halobacterium sp. KA-6 TaxID=2896368 RepID=UPI001E49ADEE|nr:hypothetical protein [Halobacterium sp. KA-6]MCD2204341.1 hypothetical protein [Halobacterium sp. KA-6]